jgi:hypothetical protein
VRKVRTGVLAASTNDLGPRMPTDELGPRMKGAVEQVKARSAKGLRELAPDIEWVRERLLLCVARPNSSQQSWRLSQKRKLTGCLTRDGRFLLPLQRWDEEHARWLIEQAWGGDPDAHDVLIDSAADLLDRHVLPPTSLCDYACAVVLGRSPKKKKSGRKNDQRNWEITLAAKSLCSLGLTPTRNRASRDAGSWQSASSLIAGWLGMSEDAVDKILQRSEHLPGVTVVWWESEEAS